VRRHRWELLLATIGTALVLSVLLVDVPHAGDVGGVLLGAGLASILYTEDEHHRRGPLRRAAAERVAAIAQGFLDAQITVNEPLTAAGWLKRPTFHELAEASRARRLDLLIVYPRDGYMFEKHFEELRTWFGGALGTRAALLSAEAQATVDVVERSLDGVHAAIADLAKQGSLYLQSARVANAPRKAQATDNMTPARRALGEALETADSRLAWLAKMTANDEALRP